MVTAAVCPTLRHAWVGAAPFVHASLANGCGTAAHEDDDAGLKISPEMPIWTVREAAERGATIATAMTNGRFHACRK